MASTKGVTEGLQGTEAHAQIRLLLTLWGLGGSEVKKSELIERLKRTGEKAEDYKSVFDELQGKEKKGGAISISKGKVQTVTLDDQGKELLRQGLIDSDFLFDRQIGARTANFLLRWMREEGCSSKPDGAHMKSGEGKVQKEAIASYKEFKPTALELFETLDKEYNYSGLVPIWHIRHELGDRIGRTEFNDWMMEMQAEQVFYLQTGEARGATEKQKRDSITNEIRGLLFFASKPL